jgi:hypothetical protein
VRYTDEKRKRSFDETLNLDLDQYMHINTVTRHGAHDIHERLKEIRDIFKKWASGTGKGMLALSLEESRAEGQRQLKMMKARERQHEAKGD